MNHSPSTELELQSHDRLNRASDMFQMPLPCQTSDHAPTPRKARGVLAIRMLRETHMQTSLPPLRVAILQEEARPVPLLLS